MITGKIVAGTDRIFPGQSVYTSSGSTAITTMILCNTLNPTSTEYENGIIVNIYLVTSRSGQDNSSVGAGSLIANGLYIPAGETVIFSDERIILDNNDLIYVSYSMSPEHLALPMASTQGNALTITISTLPV